MYKILLGNTDLEIKISLSEIMINGIDYSLTPKGLKVFCSKMHQNCHDFCFKKNLREKEFFEISNHTILH